MSTFSGISTALTGLQAQRRVMEVVGQNVANANTPGYTRQRAELQSIVANSGPSMQYQTTTVGNGVTVTNISRATDPVLQQRIDRQSADHAMLSAKSDTLSSIEAITNEPGTDGLSARLNEMWQAWSNAATTAGSTVSGASAAARAVVLQKSVSVAQTLNTANANLTQLWTTTAQQAQADIGEINATASSVAALNAQIQKVVVADGSANELMDQRDQLVTRLAELTGSTAQQGPNGQVSVFVGGTALVDGIKAATMKLTAPVSPRDVATTPLQLTITQGVSSIPVSLPSGGLQGRLEALQTRIPGEISSYDALAAKVATTVNAVQTTPGGIDGNGLTITASNGTPVFAGVTSGGVTTYTAENLKVNTGLTGNQLVLGKAANGPNDGSNAALVAKSGATATGPDAMWSAHVAGLAAESSTATDRTTAAQQLLTSSVSAQQGQSGVSLDEEAAGLIQAQRAYQGAARVLTALDQMLETLMSTGLVGR